LPGPTAAVPDRVRAQEEREQQGRPGVGHPIGMPWRAPHDRGHAAAGPRRHRQHAAARGHRPGAGGPGDARRGWWPGAPRRSSVKGAVTRRSGGKCRRRCRGGSG
jgi:hypothetical protein